MKITNEKLEQLRQKAVSDPLNNTLRHVLVKSRLQDASLDLEQLENLEFKFSKDIKTLPVTNQKASGRCWLFAGLNVLRHIVSKKINVDQLELSQSYLAFYDKIEKINYFLYNIDNFLDSDLDDREFQFFLTFTSQDGGYWQWFANLVKKYGIVPKNVMQETTSSSQTSLMNSFIDRRLKKFVAEARLLKCQNDIEKIEKLRNQTLSELYSFLYSNYGMPPKKFSFEYVDKKKKYHHVSNLTPQKFYDKYVAQNIDDYICVTDSPTLEYNKLYQGEMLTNVFEVEGLKFINLGLDRLKQLTVQGLDNDEILWFGCNVSQNSDREFGYWDDKLFNYQETFNIDLELSKKDSITYRALALEHAMVLCGYNKVDGKINKWKIENSWGDTGQKGIWLGSDTWFDKAVSEVIINKKYLKQEELDLLNSTSTLIKAWDPSV